MFNSASQIDKYLVASVLLARSSAALASQVSNNTGVKDRLNKIDAYLGFCEDLMVSDSISQQSLNEANQVGARVDLLIAQPSTGPIALTGFTISPNEAAKIDTTVTSPFTTQTGFVPNGTTPYELANVTVTISGRAAPLLMVSPTQIAFVVPNGVTGGLADVVVTSREGYIFNGTAAVAGLNPVILGLLGDTSGQAAALEAVAFQSGGFSTVGSGWFGLDSRTRVSISASGISTGVTNTDGSNDIFLGFGQVLENLSESVTVEARKSDGSVYLLPVEFAGGQGTLVGLDQVNVVLVPELRGAGTVELTMVVGGVRSNTMTITVQ